MTDSPLRPSMPNSRNARDEFNRVSPQAAGVGLFAAAIGLLVLIGWAWDIPLLKSACPGFVSMKANTAVGFVLAGWSLASLGYAARVRRLRFLALAGAAGLALLGLLTLAEYLLHCDLGIDQWLFADPRGAVGTLVPGRMAPFAALNFLLLGGALIFARWRRSFPVAQWLALSAALIALLPLMGYLYGAPAHYGVGYYAQMALHTAVLFVLVSLGVHLLHPGHGLMRTLTPDTMGGWLLRRMMPFVIGVPIVLGWLRGRGDQDGYFEHQFGDALVMTFMIFLLTALVWWTARTLTRMDTDRRETDAELQTRRRQLAQAMDLAHLANWEFDARADQFTFDERFYALFGTTVEREGGSRMSSAAYTREFVYPADAHLVAEEIAEALHAVEPHYAGHVEHRIVRRDGKIRDLVVHLEIDRAADGQIIGWHGANQDITELKEAERQLRDSNLHLSQLNHDLESTASQIKGLMTNVVSHNAFTGRFENPALTPCWIARNCASTTCPSYGNHENLRCWEIAGTHCAGAVQGTFSEKLDTCSRCACTGTAV